MAKPSVCINQDTLRALTGYQLQRSTSAAMLRYKAVFASHNLRRTTFSCLSLIIENPSLRQGQLAEALSIERSNIVQIIEDLTGGGLIRREPSKEDRRAYSLFATTKGTALFQETLVSIQELDRQMTRGLEKDEFRVLGRALSQIEENAKQAKVDPS